MRIERRTPYWPSGDFVPRRWQEESTALVLRHLRLKPDVPCIVRAVMGSGKSAVIASLLCSLKIEKDEVAVVTVPTQLLVRQLHRELLQWFKPFYRKTGRYFARCKEWNVPVVVCCIDSLANLTRVLRENNRKVCLWIADEVHRTENATVLDVYDDFAPERAVGFTATAFRASKEESLSLWRKLLYDYGPSKALKDGVVVPYRVSQYEGAGSVMRDQACLEMVKSAKGPGLVNADGIEDAEKFSQYLCHNGVRSEAVHCNSGLTFLRNSLKRLARGELDAVVHVSLLAEGVNIPWLRWLCMRRCVASRVRFCQEVGRILRSSKDKKEAVIYDPHDLFGLFKLDYRAVLGGEASNGDGDDLPAIPDPLAAPSDDKSVRARAVVEGYLRQLSLAFDAAELVQRFVGGRWRDLAATPKQQGFLSTLTGSVACPKVPDEHRSSLDVALSMASTGLLTRGIASDLISILLGLQRHETWPEVMVPEPIPPSRVAELR